MKVRTLPVAAIAIAMAAIQCAQAAPVVAKLFERTAPPRGEPASVEVGQAALISEHFLAVPAVRLLSEVTSRGVFASNVVLRPGLFILDHANSDGSFYKSQQPIGLRQMGFTDWAYQGGIFVPNDAAKPRAAYQSTLLFAATLFPVDKIELENAPPDESMVDGFRRELIYSGVSQGIVHLSYREFKNDLARPAFTQDLSYDLTQGRDIGFRGARLHIDSADNTSLHYVVLTPLSETDKPQ